MRLIAIAAASLLLASANLVSASPLNTTPLAVGDSPLLLAQTTQPKKEESLTQKAKRTWRNITTPSHSFCVRCPIPVPLTSKVCTAKGKTVDEARATCVQQNPLCYVTSGKC